MSNYGTYFTTNKKRVSTHVQDILNIDGGYPSILELVRSAMPDERLEDVHFANGKDVFVLRRINVESRRACNVAYKSLRPIDVELRRLLDVKC